jgi:hypothetical protein
VTDSVTAEAIGRVDRGTDPLWRGHARGRLMYLAKTKPEFTTDDLWEAGVPQTRENRALGPIMLWGRRAGIITATNSVQKSRLHERNHGRRLTVWRSNIYEGEGA